MDQNSTVKTKPLIVQSDATLLLDVHDPGFERCRDHITPFAELEKSPEHIHTYRITPLSLWNAASAGFTADDILERLNLWSRFPIPHTMLFFIEETIQRYGKVNLVPTEDENKLFLTVTQEEIFQEILHTKKVSSLLIPADKGFYVPLINRGTIKQELIKIGYPVQDHAPLRKGEPLAISIKSRTNQGYPFEVRDYQNDAAQAFFGSGGPGTGYGTIVLPCGSGKTIVGMQVMELAQTGTLILTTNVAAVHQWIDELIDKTTLTCHEIGEYTGDKKEIKPITIATYQIITWRPNVESDFPHFTLFRKRDWGLIIYDEVHLLPAPVFRVTAEIQSLKRLGLTATLVREDNREGDVFSLVGPKRYDIPWRELEQKGWIAEAICHEVRLELPEELKIAYAVANKRQKFRIASENPIKIQVAKEIIENHPEDSIMVIGQYLDQLKELAQAIKAPLITGKTPNPEREKIYARFKAKQERIIIVSKVANFAIDLPDASLAIQVSGSFGSRQEEAQRLGRILRPKKRNSYFYSLVSRYTTEEEFALNRQKFLTEQGYKYHIEIWDH